MTKKQKTFCDEYLIDLNATQAAIRAGYSSKTADRMAERSKRTGISQDRVIQELARIAFVNPQNVINPKDASVKADATEDDLACIQSVKVKTMDGSKGKSVEREVRLNDKMKALELLGKHLGMFKDKLEVDADMDLNITIDYGEDDAGES